MLFNALLFGSISYAQLSIDAGSTNFTIDFDNTLSGVNNGVFNGSGFSSTPPAGNLDADAWKITGLSDGNHNFGDTNTSGDFARGTDSDGAGTGGLYAFEVETANYALGFQPIGSDLTPGTIVLKIKNNTTSTITDIAISYNAWIYNDQDKSNSLNFSHSLDDSTYTDVASLNLLSTEAAASSPDWVSTAKSTTITGLNLAIGASIYVRWSTDEISGSGSMDQIAIDDIVVNATTDAAIPTTAFNSTTSSVTETTADQTVLIPVTMYNIENTVSLSVTPSGTANVADYTLNTSSLTFNTNTTQNISLTIKNDADMLNETVILTLAETTATDVTISNSIHTVTITDDDIPNIIINEILADPGTNIDANGDGIISSNDDEFIEFVNLDNVSYDLTGYTVSDASVRYTFGSVTIPAGGSVVIFGGGTPTGIPGISDTTSNLGLSNSGDTVSLKNTEGTTIATYTYGGEANDDQSIARNNDATGDFVKHTTISTNPVTASPGRTNISNLPFIPITWNGNTNNVWTTDSNWTPAVTPVITSDVIIPSGLSTYPTITTGTAATTNTIAIASGASLIAEGTSTVSGVVTYKRQLTIPTETGDFTIDKFEGWYLLSPPVSGEEYNDLYVSLNYLASGTSTNKGLAIYTENDNSWNYFADTESGAFNSGQGYSIKRSITGNVSFTGTLNIDNVTTPALARTSNGFHLVGNPYTAHISSESFLDDNPTLSNNKTIWTWNKASKSYTARISTADFIIPPGQGFFVQVNTGGGTLSFNETNQTHNLGDDNNFQKSTKTALKLKISDNTTYREAIIYYSAGVSKGYENGYEGEIFGGKKTNFEVYTQILENNVGKNYQVQSLPNTNYESMIIPVGLITENDKEIIFTAETLNLPSELKVYLEDREKNIFTRLDVMGSKYKTTINESLNGIGRFYLHTSSKSVLHVDTIALENISIYKTNNSTLRIIGLLKGKTTMKMFSLLGKQVLKKPFISNGVQDISLPKLATGVYVIQLETETGRLNKKIILD